VGITEVCSPNNSTRNKSGGRPLSPGARSNPSRGRADTTHAPEAPRARVSLGGEGEPAEVTVTGPAEPRGEHPGSDNHRRSKRYGWQGATLEGVVYMSATKPPDRPHAYDNPSLNAKQFLFCVMRDPTVALELRMRAAELLRPLLEPWDTPSRDAPVVTYVLPKMDLQ
jgi:hypothetical protein